MVLSHFSHLSDLVKFLVEFIMPHEGEVKKPLPFLVHNQALIAKIEGLRKRSAAGIYSSIRRR